MELGFISAGYGSSKRTASSKLGTPCCSALKLEVCQKTDLHKPRRSAASHSRVGGPRRKLPSRLTPFAAHAQAKRPCLFLPPTIACMGSFGCLVIRVLPWLVIS